MSKSSQAPNPNEVIQLGLSALKQSRFQDAFDAFDSLITRGVENASIWLAMAYASKGLGNRDALSSALNKSLELEPRNPRAYILKADMFVDEGDQQAAATFYMQALKLSPPPEQTPPDLKVELERAREQHQSLNETFQNHLLKQLEAGLGEAGQKGERVQTSIDYLLGKKNPYFQQPKKYFFPFLPHVEFYPTDEFSWVPMLEESTDEIREELGAAIEHEERFVPYLAGSDDRPEADHELKDNRDWGAFYLWKNGKLVEENAALCPKTIEILKKIPMQQIEGSGPNVLFSRLRPKTKIPPHNGFVNTRFICHLPLIVPDGCGFRVGNDVRRWKEGKVWLFDDTIEHEAWNDSEEDRYILLFEVWRPELTEIEIELVTNILESIKAFAP